MTLTEAQIQQHADAAFEQGDSIVIGPQFRGRSRGTEGRARPGRAARRGGLRQLAVRSIQDRADLQSPGDSPGVLESAGSRERFADRRTRA